MTLVTPGWAVFDNGQIDMKTIYETRRGAIVNWLMARANVMLTRWTLDPEIEELWNQYKGSADLVEVIVQVKAQ